MTITLPLPDRTLSPNARVHWAKLAKAKKLARAMAKRETFRQVGIQKFASYRLLFFWKNKQRHDRDNASASCKAYLDGVADCCQQDDSEWGFDGVRFEIDRERPRLEIQFEVKY